MGISKPVLGLYDLPMWASIDREQLELQACAACGRFRYPPSPACPDCLSMAFDWKPVSGKGTILSWVVFHRKYFDDHPPPYNAVAVRLDEGPIVISNLVGEPPTGSWIGAAVELCYTRRGERMIHQVRMAVTGAKAQAIMPERRVPG